MAEEKKSKDEILMLFLESLLADSTTREKMKSLIEQYENDDKVWLDEVLGLYEGK